jgi:Chitobiase/beta-hexosaminidase C-terminal domain
VKSFLFPLLALATFIAPAHAITVTNPANGAQVTSPFTLVASTSTCSSKPAVSMGYSIDSGATTIVPTSFSASVSASAGAHILHVKCWGQGVNAVVNLNITVGSSTTASMIVKSPIPGATVSSPFSLSATAAVCSSQSVAAMGYSLDSSSATTTVKAQSVQAAVVAAAGAHTLHVKAWGNAGSSCVTNVAITVGSTTTTTAATPAFSPGPGTFTSAQLVTLSDATAGAAIHYTTNGSAPTTSSAIYSGPISVAASAVIEAVAVAPGYANSGLARADFVIKPPPSAPVVPSNAIAASDVQALNTWIFNHDAGTPGSAVGTTNLVGTPSLSGNTRQFASSYTDAGGEIYSVVYANDAASSNFVYDGWVWIEAGSSIANLEMDSNQVTANGQTVIYAFQCSGYDGVWEYSGAGAKWVHSSQPCNPSTWPTNVWHHVQISYSRDDAGNVTYQSVWLDGTEQAINATVPSSFALGWQVGVVQTQFQVDGLGTSGSSTVYLDNLTISRW